MNQRSKLRRSVLVLFASVFCITPLFSSADPADVFDPLAGESIITSWDAAPSRLVFPAVAIPVLKDLWRKAQNSGHEFAGCFDYEDQTPAARQKRAAKARFDTLERDYLNLSPKDRADAVLMQRYRDEIRDLKHQTEESIGPPTFEADEIHEGSEMHSAVSDNCSTKELFIHTHPLDKGITTEMLSFYDVGAAIMMGGTYVSFEQTHTFMALSDNQACLILTPANTASYITQDRWRDKINREKAINTSDQIIETVYPQFRDYQKMEKVIDGERLFEHQIDFFPNDMGTNPSGRNAAASEYDKMVKLETIAAALLKKYNIALYCGTLPALTKVAPVKEFHFPFGDLIDGNIILSNSPFENVYGFLEWYVHAGQLGVISQSESRVQPNAVAPVTTSNIDVISIKMHQYMALSDDVKISALGSSSFALDSLKLDESSGAINAGSCVEWNLKANNGKYSIEIVPVCTYVPGRPNGGRDHCRDVDKTHPILDWEFDFSDANHKSFETATAKVLEMDYKNPADPKHCTRDRYVTDVNGIPIKFYDTAQIDSW